MREVGLVRLLRVGAALLDLPRHEDVGELRVQSVEGLLGDRRLDPEDERVADVPEGVVDAVERLDLLHRLLDVVGDREEVHVLGRDITFLLENILAQPVDHRFPELAAH